MSTGLFDCCVRLRSSLALRELSPNWEAMAKVSRRHDLCGFHAYALLGEEPVQGGFSGADVYARNFAPAFGIHEEAATGTANGALASLLWRSGAIPPTRTALLVAQGDFMEPLADCVSRTSRVYVEATGTPGEGPPSVGGSAGFARLGKVDLATLLPSLATPPSSSDGARP